MPIQRIAHSSTEIDVENYIGILRAGQSISDTGWSIYADSAGVNPVDGLGGSPSITWSQNTTSPLSGEVDLKLVKDANNRQGNGVSIPFTVANRHLGKVLQISFDTELISGNYESPIITPTNGTYTITSTTVCTVTASHSFVAGQVVNMTFTSGTRPVDGFYTIVSVTTTTFVITVASGSATNATCSYTVPADLRVSIIQNPSGTPVVIEPVNTSIQLGIANQRIRHIASFQTHISITSYRLCVHVSNASTVAYTVDFANFKVWEPTQSIGAVITDWQSYTPTFTQQNGSTLPNITPNTFLWRRVGDSIEILGRFSVTGSLGTYIDINFNLPNGLQFKYLTPPPPMPFHYGTGLFIGGGGSSQPVITKLDPVSNGRLRIQYQTSNTTIVFGQFTNITYTGANGDHFTFETISIPIAGWGSSVAMSSDSSLGRVIIGSYYGHTGVTLTANVTTLKFNTLRKDTHNIYNTSTGVVTIPVSGDYRFDIQALGISSGNTFIQPYVNGVALSEYAGYIGTNNTGNFGITIPNLFSGSTVDFRSPNSSTTSTTTYSVFSFFRISADSQVIASSESVNVIARTVSNSISSSYSSPSWTSKEVDSYSAFTSNSSRFTAPMSGIYRFSVSFGTSNGNAGVIRLLNVSTSTSLRLTLNPPDASNRLSVSLNTELRLISGQQIDIQFSIISGTATLSSSLSENFLSITRVGNY